MTDLDDERPEVYPGELTERQRRGLLVALALAALTMLLFRGINPDSVIDIRLHDSYLVLGAEVLALPLAALALWYAFAKPLTRRRRWAYVHVVGTLSWYAVGGGLFAVQRAAGEAASRGEEAAFDLLRVVADVGAATTLALIAWQLLLLGLALASRRRA